MFISKWKQEWIREQRNEVAARSGAGRVYLVHELFWVGAYPVVAFMLLCIGFIVVADNLGDEPLWRTVGFGAIALAGVLGLVLGAIASAYKVILMWNENRGGEYARDE